MRVSRTLVAMSTVAAAVAAATTAHATSRFPDAVVAHIQLSYVPPCSLCHASPSGGGPMAKAFGVALQQRGLVAGDEASLERALDQLESDGVDSDANGVPDLAQLRAGIDPSTGESLLGPDVTYGCTAFPTGSTHGGTGWPSFAALGVALLLLRRGELE